jgi:hypothetical protein
MTHEEAMHAAQLKRAWADEGALRSSRPWRNDPASFRWMAGVILESELGDLIQGEDDEEP